MAIEIRAVTTCSLGDLISASISDDYIQGTGLIKTQGSCLINGIIAPTVGTSVAFTYTKRGITRSIPRALRVLSFFADPYRKTTEVQLGCKLTYLQDKKDPIDWDVLLDGPANIYDENDAEVIVIPVKASDIMDKCLDELGITASSNPLTNQFSIAKFDLSNGYVNVLSDLLVSESYCGYLDKDENLQVFSLQEPTPSGPVIDRAKTIDVGSLGFGQLPGESVVVSYNTIKLKKPDAIDQGGFSIGIGIDDDFGSGWDRSLSTNYFTIQVQYEQRDGGPATSLTQSYNVSETTEITNTYQTIGFGRNAKRVLKRRQTDTVTQSVAIAGAVLSEYLSNGITFPNVPVYKTTYEEFTYDGEGNQIKSDRLVIGSVLYVIGSLGLRFVFSNTDYVVVNAETNTFLDREIVVGVTSGDYTNQTTYTLGTWFQTIQGQQSIAASQKAFRNSGQVSTFINQGFDNALHTLDTRQFVETKTSLLTEAPDKVSVILSRNINQDIAGSSSLTESVSELELAFGSPGAQLRIEFSMPYAPDDIFAGPPGGPYISIPSDAPQKARTYGIVQNRLLHGNRFGMSIQTAPEDMPATPFQSFVVNVDSQNALYVTNGTSWTISNEGVVASTDGLFWGGVGGSGPAWFPTAPGVSPTATPPVIVDTSPTLLIGTIATVGNTPQDALNTAFPGAVSGNGVQDLSTDRFWVYNGSTWVDVGPTPGPTATASVVLPVWNEKVKVLASTRTSIEVRSYPYSLSPTTSVELNTSTGIEITSTFGAIISIPVTNFTLTAFAPATPTPEVVPVPTVTLTLVAHLPIVTVATIVETPVTAFTLTAYAPTVIGSVVVEVPATVLTLTSYAPTVIGSVAVEVPATALTLTSYAPSVFIINSSLLLHFDGADASATFTDSSPNSFTVTPSGDAQISTTGWSKFGGAAGLFDGNGDYLTVGSNAVFDFGTGDFLIGAFVNLASIAGDWFIASASGSGGMFFGYTNSQLTKGWGVGRNAIAWDFIRAAVPVVGTEYWVVVQRVSGVMSLWVNGVQLGTTGANAQSYNISTGSLTIASQGGDFYLNGRMDELLILKGAQDFAPFRSVPTSPFPKYSPPVVWVPITALTLTPHIPSITSVVPAKLFLEMEGANGSTTFTDSSPNGYTVTANGGAAISTAQFFSGSSSAFFDGVDDYLSVTVPGGLNGTGNWRMTFYAYPIGGGGNSHSLFVSRSSGISNDGFDMLSGLRISTSGALIINTSTALTLNVWTKVTIERIGDTLTRKYNDVTNGTGGLLFLSINWTGTSFRIGGNPWPSGNLGYFRGYIDQFRLDYL
jgi:hypothetical protein